MWQWFGEDANGGLVEGIADWVRLKAGLAPPHWSPVYKDCKWDDGYETTTYFLNWIEERTGERGLLVRMNQMLRQRYVEQEFWRYVYDGRNVRDVWAEYARDLRKRNGEEGDYHSPPRSVRSWRGSGNGSVHSAHSEHSEFSGQKSETEEGKLTST